nr:MAG TPA: hypothetical protein [Caudoviricetes sp.]
MFRLEHREISASPTWYALQVGGRETVQRRIWRLLF